MDRGGLVRWVLQNNIYEEEGYARIVDAIQRRGLPLTHVKVKPFVGEILAVDGDLPGEGEKAVVLGSYSLTRKAAEMGWMPGAWLDNLDFRDQEIKWNGLMLNSDATIHRFVDVPFQERPFFMRPVHDTKAFTGLVLDWGQYTQWRDGILRLPEEVDPENDPLGVNLLTADTPVMVCQKKEIWSETRTWVIPGTTVHRTSLTPVVTSSQYKVGTLKRYQAPEFTDLRILEFVDRAVDIWYPNEAFVMDVADTPDGLKIVEVNNLNSAGFYRADMGRLVEALESRFG